MRTIRWGIVGCGNVTEVKSGPGFQKAENSELVAVMRRNGDLAKDYARRHDVPRWYDNAGKLIHDPEVDAVYVATPPYAHEEYVAMAAAAGKPVYVEKPMALNYSECLAMNEACEAAGVPLWVAYYRRTLPRFLKVKELLDKGAIGDVRFVTVRLYQKPRLDHSNGASLPWRVVPELSGGGIFVDLASHVLDYLDYFLGPIAQAHGQASNQGGLYDAEDTVAGSFAFESGVQGTGIWCFAAYAEMDETEIVGTRGKVSFSSFGTEAVRLSQNGNRSEVEAETPPHVQQPLIQTIVDELNGSGSCPSSGISAARTSWVMDQMLRSYYENRGQRRGG